ncbi:MAG: hypothetical protein LQ339_003432 [Xanthoria mediterranea]|nr:MAG: hypothetical protein LQ339_003432 [Xanthoria mediterranea]
MSSESLSQSSQNQNASQATKVLPLQPFSESDNPDAIALRSAISVLQIQRQQALRDLAALEKQKKLAAADPKAFAMDLMTGEVKEVATGPLSSQTGFPLPSNDVQKENGEQVESDSQAHKKTKHLAFGDIPGSQDVVRCPPIEWAKYHVLGQPLDTLHEEQRKRPLDGQRSEDAQIGGAEHVIAAPYDPFSDRGAIEKCVEGAFRLRGNKFVATVSQSPKDLPGGVGAKLIALSDKKDNKVGKVMFESYLANLPPKPM